MERSYTKEFNEQYLKLKIVNLEKELSKSKNDNEILREQLNIATNKYNTEISKRRIIETKFKETSKAHKELYQQFQSATSLNSASELIPKLKAKLSKKDVKISALKSKVNGLVNQISKLRRELQKKQSFIPDCQTLYKELEDLKENYRKISENTNEPIDVERNSLLAAIEIKTHYLNSLI